MYELAELVQARCYPGSVDSAFLAYRALQLVLRVLVRLHGDEPPEGFADLVERAQAISVRESLTKAKASADLVVVDEMFGRLTSSTPAITPADERRYDRALLQLHVWFDAGDTYLDQRVPAPESRLKRRFMGPVAVVLALGIGLLIGRHLPSRNPTPLSRHDTSPPPVPASASAPAAPPAPAAAFDAIYYRDTTFDTIAFSRQDERIVFDWKEDSPPGVDQPDHFSIRWLGKLQVPETGEYTFRLTSDDGSRLFLGDKIVVDNWGAHSERTATGTVKLVAGVHPIKVEYFDNVGGASIRVEWSSAAFELRPIAAADLR